MKKIITAELIHTKRGLVVDFKGVQAPLEIPEGKTWLDFPVKTKLEFEVFWRLTYPREPRNDNRQWSTIEAESLKMMSKKILDTSQQIKEILDMKESEAEAKQKIFIRPATKEFGLSLEKAKPWVRLIYNTNPISKKKSGFLLESNFFDIFNFLSQEFFAEYFKLDRIIGSVKNVARCFAGFDF